MKYAIGVVVLGIIALQFCVPPSPGNRLQNPNDFLLNNQIAPGAAGALRAACYDCHSMETKYPWYSQVAPISGFVFHHIEEGREELNFSDWQAYDKGKKLRKLKEIREEVEEGGMPLAPYALVHGEARLSADQKQLIVDWAGDFSKTISSE